MHLTMSNLALKIVHMMRNVLLYTCGVIASLIVIAILANRVLWLLATSATVDEKSRCTELRRVIQIYSADATINPALHVPGRCLSGLAVVATPVLYSIVGNGYRVTCGNAPPFYIRYWDKGVRFGESVDGLSGPPSEHDEVLPNCDLRNSLTK